MKRLPLFLLTSSALILGTVVFLTPRDAQACSPQCFQPIVAPKSGVLPASAPGILVELGSSGGGSSTNGFELRDAAGSVVAGAFKKDPSGRNYFAPTTPFIANQQYSVSMNSVCDDGPPKVTSFNVTEAKPLPTTSGKLSVAAAKREERDVITSSGSCTEPVDAAMVDLKMDVDATTGLYQEVLSWETEVDGKYWSRSEGQLAQPDSSSYAHSLMRLFTACDTTGTKGRHPGVQAGPHDVEVRAILVGGQPIAPAKIRVKVTCGADNGEVLPQAEPPKPQLPVTTPTPPGGSSGTTPTTPNQPTDPNTSSSGGDGCSAGRKGEPTISSASPWLLLALAGGLVGRRRRRSA